MSKVIYSMALSLDGFVAGPRGEIAVVPDEELHRFHNREAREFGVHLYGRRLYEVMSAWETYADEYRLFVHPVLVGGGTPFFPPLDERIDLHLVETRKFGSGRSASATSPTCCAGVERIEADRLRATLR